MRKTTTSTTVLRKLLVVALFVALAVLVALPAGAAPVQTTDFESFTLGSVNYQGTGSTTTTVNGYTIPDPYGSLWTVADEWGFTGNFDQEVKDDGTGNKVWRFSNALTPSGYSNQPNSPSSPAVAGESSAYLYNDRGDNHTSPVSPPNPRAGATTPYFHGGFKFKSATDTAQPGLLISINPVPRQTTYRMSYVGIKDVGTGFDLIFSDTSLGGNFNATTIASGLSYSEWHQVDIYADFVDGLNSDGSGNDIVTIVVNGTPVHTGTTWESYFAENSASFPSPIAVDALLFRASGTAAAGTLGNGLFFDDVVVDNAQLAVADTEGPQVTCASPDPVAVNTADVMIATVDDSATGGSIVTSATATLNGTSTAVSPADDAWDEVSENLSITAPPLAGVYDLMVSATDSEGNTTEVECADLVVYDPTGGFVTGGGWIMSPEGAASVPVWNQNFSVDDAGWLDDDDSWYGDIIVAGGTATFFGAETGPFSRFDGYRTDWPGTWVAEIDVYLDPAWPAGQGFDYSVAANGTDGEHQRDYIFHVGVVEDYGPITGSALLVNGSNNADFRTNPFKLVNDNGGNYYTVTAAGWYTLQHLFRDAGGYLAVDLNLLDGSGNILWTATRENPADTIPGEVGGNRYAWFTHIDVAAGIQVDNHQLFMNMPSPEGKASFGFISRYKKGASVPDGNTQFSFKAGNLDFHSSSYEWLVVNRNDSNAQFKGEGTVNGMGLYKFMLWGGDYDAGDTFRIKIWDDGTGSVIYDNGTDRVIGGGNIIVHTGKSK